MPTNDEEHKHDLEVLLALNRAIEQGPWEYNLFFQTIGKKLVELRDKFQQDLHLTLPSPTAAGGSVKIPARLASRIVQRTGLLEVFVSLYNSDGNNIVKWENILASISKHSINRPVYRTEAEAKSVLRVAINKQNEAYAAVYIRDNDIVGAEVQNPSFDRHGNSLLNLKEGSLHPENITNFVHLSGRYEFENNKLVWLGSADFL